MGIRAVIKYKKASPKINMKTSELQLSLSKKNHLKNNYLVDYKTSYCCKLGYDANYSLALLYLLLKITIPAIPVITNAAEMSSACVGCNPKIE